MKKVVFPLVVTLLLVGMLGCSPETATTTTTALFPTAAPEISVPEAFELTAFDSYIEETGYPIDGNLQGYRFEDCQVVISADNIIISHSQFVNSQVFVNNRNNVTFQGCIFSDLYQYEHTALMLYQSEDISIDDCQFLENYIGLGVHESTAAITGCRFENNNGHNAVVIGEGSSAEVTGSYFYGSFPHAMLIMNREGFPEAAMEITSNLIEFTGQDAINFEDYRDATPTLVAGNVIRNTGWSAVLVEYNSWNANITIRDNWIERTGIDWTLPVHDLLPESYQPGWGHGVLIEDSSRVTVERNRIILAGQNGIEVRNSREVTLDDNGIDCADVGVAVYGYHESSLSREVSPLSPDDADGSLVVASGNVIYAASREWEVDEVSALLWN